jgi:hypothetical protein
MDLRVAISVLVRSFIDAQSMFGNLLKTRQLPFGSSQQGAEPTRPVMFCPFAQSYLHSVG